MQIFPRKLRENEIANKIGWAVTIIFIAGLFLFLVVMAKWMWEESSFDDITTEINQCTENFTNEMSDIWKIRPKAEEEFIQASNQTSETYNNFVRCFETTTQKKNIYIEK